MTLGWDERELVSSRLGRRTEEDRELQAAEPVEARHNSRMRQWELGGTNVRWRSLSAHTGREGARRLLTKTVGVRRLKGAMEGSRRLQDWTE